MQNQKVVHILLRLSIASVFLYAAIAATLQPQNWIWYIPQFARNMLPSQTLLAGFSFYQLLLSLWILSGRKTLYAASLSSLTLLGIIIVNVNILDVLFRDFAIFFASLALAVGSYTKGIKQRK
ncbi:MAG TPA: hypothetical protein VN711_00955 [Candidatus Saccharimonadales bacterium]|nr:hypothetical protein [Candidatus Saccharimonadales bacterium]